MWFTEYNKKGIAVSQQNCMVNDINYVNYFKKDILIQHIDHLNDTYFYYSENGLLYKSVKLDYGTETIEETFFNYDEEGNIVKKDIYQNKDYNSIVCYDSEGNVVKEYYKDDDGSEHMVTEFRYDKNNMLTEYIKDKDLHCNYSYNNFNDVILETKCYIFEKGVERIKQKTDIKVLVTNREIDNRLNTVMYNEKDSTNSSLNKIELKYNN